MIVLRWPLPAIGAWVWVSFWEAFCRQVECGCRFQRGQTCGFGLWIIGTSHGIKEG